jgi:hypothetical protein
MQFLHHRRIPREPRRIELLHLLLQVVDLLLRGRIALRRLPQLVQLTHALLNHPLRIRQIPVDPWRRATPRSVIRLSARIDVQVRRGAAPTAAQRAVDVSSIQLAASRPERPALPVSSLRSLVSLPLLSALPLLPTTLAASSILPSLLSLTTLSLPVLSLPLLPLLPLSLLPLLTLTLLLTSLASLHRLLSLTLLTLSLPNASLLTVLPLLTILPRLLSIPPIRLCPPRRQSLQRASQPIHTI